MKPRSLTHAGAGWSSLALHLQAAGDDKSGFYLSVYPDGRPPANVFVRGDQLEKLVEMAEDPVISEQALWDAVAHIPLEPLLPSRTLGTRLRWLLCDCKAQIRAEISAQRLANPPPAPTAPADSDERDAVATPKATWE